MTNCNLRKKGFVMAYGPKGGGVHHGTGKAWVTVCYTHTGIREGTGSAGAINP